MSLSVKSYLIRANGKEEVRRFIMDEAESNKDSLSIIWEKLNKFYGENLQEKGFALFWKDDDDDDIIMSSGEELITAIKSQKTGVLKIYIQKPKNGKKFSKQQDASDIHTGVTCDGCEGGVSGMRYKCMQCPDYDLCSKCEHKSLHPEHVMVRIPLSSARNFGSGHPFHPFWMNPAFYRGRHGGGCGWRRGHKFHQQRETPFQQCSGQQQQQQQYAFNPADFLERVWKHIGNFVPQAGTARNPQPSDTPEDQPFKPEEYLQSVGESVAAMLDPLGINVVVDVEHDGERQRCGEPRNDGQTSTPFKNENKTPESSTDEKMETDAPSAAECEGATASDVPTSNVKIPNTDGDKTQGVQRNTAAEYINNLSKALNSFVVSQQNHTSPNDQNMSSERDSPNILDTSDWTYVNYQDREQDTNTTPQQTVNYQDKEQDANTTPQQTEIKKVADEPHASASPSHPDPVIASSIDQMLSMGYDNEGNWLAVLLDLNDGDIDRTLEMITSLQHNPNSLMQLVFKLIEKCNGDVAQLLTKMQAIKNHL